MLVGHGKQLLKPETIELMFSDQLNGAGGGFRFGLGFAIKEIELGTGDAKRKAKEVSWGGYASTDFRIVPDEGLFQIFFRQRVPSQHGLASQTFPIIYRGLSTAKVSDSGGDRDLPRASWPQFRGVNSSGIATGPAPPIEFGPGTNELWKTPVAAGHSSPCISGDRIFLTTFDESSKELAVVCLDKETGETRWRRSVPTEKIEKGHPSFNPASSSPACDGDRVVAYFGSFGLICFDLDGAKLWEVPMPLAKSFGGNAASPIIVGDRVILYRGCYVDHFLLAVDKETGDELWRVPQDEPFTGEMACTACPIVASDKLIVHTARSLQAFNLNNGEQIWETKCATTATSTPVIAGDQVIVAAWNKMGEPALRPEFPSFDELLERHDEDKSGSIGSGEFPELWIFHRPDGAEAPMNGAKIGFKRTDSDQDGNIDRDEWERTLEGIKRFRAGYQNHGILTVPIESRGVVDTQSVRTLETEGIPEVPSPLFDGKYIYFVKNGGVLTCIDHQTGDRVYRMRTRGRGTHYASPLIAEDKLFTVAGDGKITVIQLGPEPKILAVNDMKASVYATPAIVGGVLYVRTHRSLHAFGE